MSGEAFTKTVRSGRELAKMPTEYQEAVESSPPGWITGRST